MSDDIEVLSDASREITDSPLDGTTLVSVIVPCYNVAKYLQQCLNSIRQQTLEQLEIICVNDGSTDNTLEILQSNAARDKRIKIIDKKNAGYGAACNTGMDAATGAWVSIVEPDDWLELGMYFSMLVFFLHNSEDENGRIDIIKTPYWRIWQPDTDRQRKINCSYKGWVNPPVQPFKIEDASILLSDHPSIWSAIYRREFIRDFNIRFEELPGSGWTDNHFLIKTLCQASNILYFDVPFYCYREDTVEKEQELTRKNGLMPIDRWMEMLDIIEDIGITDQRILASHYIRGFYYASGVIEVFSLNDQVTKQAVIALFERMDPEIVFNEPQISPDHKRLFISLLGLPEREIDEKAYRRLQFKSGLKNLKNTGIKNTWFRLNDSLRRKDARTGKE